MGPSGPHSFLPKKICNSGEPSATLCPIEPRPSVLEAKVFGRLASYFSLSLDLYYRPELESRTQGSRPRPRTQKNPRPRTALPRTDPLEAKYRNARGLGPRTQAQVFSKKKGPQKFFWGDLQKNFSGVLQWQTSSKIFFQAIYKISTIQKKVLSSSRGQGNFRGLGASRPRPRTWPSRPKPRTSKCVLEDVLEDSTSVNDYVQITTNNGNTHAIFKLHLTVQEIAMFRWDCEQN